MTRLNEYLNKTNARIELVKIESLNEMDKAIESLNARNIKQRI